MILISLLLTFILMSQSNIHFSLSEHTYVKPDCRAQIHFVYIKMIKCASTTLTNVFRRFGLQRRLSFVLPPKGRMYVGWPYQIDDSFYRASKSATGFDIFCDHAVYNRMKFRELMGHGTVYITSVREPFSEFKSMVNYYNVLNISRVPLSVVDRFAEFVTNIEKYEAIYKTAEASPARYCIPDGFSMTRNLMSFNLGFPTGGFRSADKDLAHDSDLVRRWLAELDAEFSLVIITEHFDESMVLFRRMMCWSLTDVLFLADGNAYEYEYKNTESAELVEIYRRWSSVDYQMYRHFNESLWRKIATQVCAHLLIVICLWWCRVDIRSDAEKIAQCLMHHHFTTVRHRITRFTPKHAQQRSLSANRCKIFVIGLNIL